MHIEKDLINVAKTISRSRQLQRFFEIDISDYAEKKKPYFFQQKTPRKYAANVLNDVSFPIEHLQKKFNTFASSWLHCGEKHTRLAFHDAK